jgi:hypothetical protein
MRQRRWSAVWLLVAACSPGGDGGDGTVVGGQFGDGNPSANNDNSGGSGGSDSAPNPMMDGDLFGNDSDLACPSGCAFTAQPLLDEGVNAADITPFAASTEFQSGGLCVLEPQLSTADLPGALFPRNWLRPRFRWTSSGGEKLWEIRLHTEELPEDLRAYTRYSEWLIPKDVWRKMRDLKKPITVTIRGLGAGGAMSGTRGNFEIAPVDAGGSLVFWATTSSLVDYLQASSKLQGFTLGDEAKGTDTDEGVGPTLNAAEVQTANVPGEDGAKPRGFYSCGDPARPTCTAQPNNPACCNPTGFEFGAVECVGCHISTPDGKAVLFTDNWPWDKVAASIEPDTRGALPATVTPYAANLLKQPWLGMQAMSPAFFSTAPGGQRILITTYGTEPAGDQTARTPWDPRFANGQGPARHQLAWFDLAANDPTNPIPEEIPPDPAIQGQQQSIYQVRDLRAAAVARARNTSWGLIATIGEQRSAVTPAWSQLGATVAYVSTDVSSTDGHPDWTANAADIFTVPYNNHAGGNVTALQGASDPNFLEYYPDYSADDAFITFVRAPNPSPGAIGRCVPQQDANGLVTACPAVDLGENPDGPYYNRNGEIFIVPSAGGTPIRLSANDPVSCSGESARGSINSWPKWSPRVAKDEVGGKTYYFLMFSSGRSYPGAFELPRARLTPNISNKSSQLYMAAIVVDNATQQVTTYPAVYLWNQNITVDAQGNGRTEPTSNLTPAWDDFSIPPVRVERPPPR